MVQAKKSYRPSAPKTDSLKQAQNSNKPATGPIAANLSTPVAMQDNKAVCVKPVPLAGQQTYFGSMNDYVNNFVRQYMNAHDKTLTVVQNRSNDHFSLMENVLQKNNIPKELKYLAVIESALNRNAVSNAGAVGPWQLMESTARLLGLTVNGRRDDRTDWYKSSQAAAKYLGKLYGQLNDWLLVVAAYNSGPTPVQRAIDRTGSHNFWDIKKYLPRETQGHVLAFIATATIFERLSNFIGLGGLPTDFKFTDNAAVAAAVKSQAPPKPQFTKEELANMAIVKISDPIYLEFMAHELDIDKKLLNSWNQDYDLFLLGTYEEKFYPLRIPKDKLDKFLEKKQYILSRSKKILDEMAM
ncbi:lytic transglycosylase domain-containing protein [Chitinophagaceae bacterium MMS25-I14]